MVHCVEGSRKVKENKYYPFLTITRLHDVVMDTVKGCFSAVTWPIRTMEWIEQRISLFYSLLFHTHETSAKVVSATETTC